MLGVMTVTCFTCGTQVEVRPEERKSILGQEFTYRLPLDWTALYDSQAQVYICRCPQHSDKILMVSKR